MLGQRESSTRSDYKQQYVDSYHIVSYSVVWWTCACVCVQDYVILDEGHKIKNPANKCAQGVHAIRARNRIVLSGTPIMNNLKVPMLLHLLHMMILSVCLESCEEYSSMSDCMSCEMTNKQFRRGICCPLTIETYRHMTVSAGSWKHTRCSKISKPLTLLWCSFVILLAIWKMFCICMRRSLAFLHFLPYLMLLSTTTISFDVSLQQNGI